MVKSSAINRFLLNRVGNKGFKLAARYWMWDQKRKGDGLSFMRWLYAPSIFRRVLWPIVKLGMLRRKQLSDGRVVNRMPFRKALKRDIWEPSHEATEIGKQWDKIRKEGAKTSFTESET